MTKTNIMSGQSISVHSQSITYILNLNVPYCAILYFLFYISCHGFLCMPALIFITDDLVPIIYTSNKIKSFHISIILYSICMFQTNCHHIQFSFHNNYNKIFKCSFLRSSYILYVLTVSFPSYTILNHCRYPCT